MTCLRFAAAVALLTLSGCRTPVAAAPPAPPPEKAQRTNAPPAPSSEPIHFTIVATNDLHGWIAGHPNKLPDGTELDEGGLAAFAGYVKIARAANPGGVLLLDGGDLFQGTLASNLSEGQVVISAMNTLGYTAAAIGNHEFDYGPAGPAPVAVSPGQDPFGALRARISEAKFPLLASNIYEAATGKRPAWLGNDGSVLIERNGIKIGIVGLITPLTPTVTNPVNVSSLRFGNLIPETEHAVKELHEHGAELILGVAHAGGFCGSLADPHDISTCDPSQEIFELFKALPPGLVDAMVAGHTHSLLGHFINGTPVIEDAAMGRYFGTIDLFLDPRTHKVLADRTAIKAGIPICAQVEATTQSCDARKVKEIAAKGPVQLVPATYLGQTVERDPVIDALIAPAMAQVEAVQNKSLGVEVPQFLGRSYETESAVGSVLADAVREMEKADVVLLNSGGLRADLRQGPLRYGDLYEVLPFDNTLATLILTGEELKRLLEAAYGAKKGVFQQSGLKLILNNCPGNGRLKTVTFSNGKPLVPTQKYRVVLPDFLARGGDGLQPVMAALPKERVDLGDTRPQNFRDALADFLQKRGTALKAPAVGRTVILEAGPACGTGAAGGPHAD